MRANVFGTQSQLAIEHRIRIADQTAPLRSSVFKLFSLGCKRAAAHIVDGRLVHRHHAHPRTGFNRHVAQGHAAFHRQRAHRAAGKFQRMAIATGRANRADDGQHHILGGDSKRQHAIHRHPQVFHFLRHQTLGG